MENRGNMRGNMRGNRRGNRRAVLVWNVLRPEADDQHRGENGFI